MQGLSYEELKRKRNRLKAALDKSKDMKSSHTYKAVRREYEATCNQIKLLFKVPR